MEIRKSEYCGYTIYELRGEVSDPKILSKIEKVITDALTEANQNIAIDLHSCDYLNSGLIGQFLGWKKIQDAHQKKFCLIEPNEKAMDVLTVCGIAEVITIYKNEIEFMKRAMPEA
jgi:anti-anti-sigma factor